MSTTGRHKVHCGCGKRYTSNNRKAHLETKYHKKWFGVPKPVVRYYTIQCSVCGKKYTSINEERHFRTWYHHTRDQGRFSYPPKRQLQQERTATLVDCEENDNNNAESSGVIRRETHSNASSVALSGQPNENDNGTRKLATALSQVKRLQEAQAVTITPPRRHVNTDAADIAAASTVAQPLLSQETSPCCTSRPVLDDDQVYAAEFARGNGERLIRVREKAEQFGRQLEISGSGKEKAARTRRELTFPDFLTTLRMATPGRAWPLTQFMQAYTDGFITPTCNVDVYVVCASDQELRHFLERALEDPGLLCRVVIRPRGGRSIVRIDDFLNHLQHASDEIPVSDLDAVPSGGAFYETPQLSGKQVLTQYHNKRCMNLLSLTSLRDNPVPYFIDGLRGYNLLTQRRDNVTHEPKGTQRSKDFTESAKFQVFSCAGSFSLEHVDCWSKLTTVEVDEGCKVWIFRVPIDEQGRATFEDPIDVVRIAIVLETGDQLLQPPNTPHTVFTPTDTIFSGTTHFVSSMLDKHVEGACLDAEYPTTTNESPYRETVVMLEYVNDQLHHKPADPRWGPSDEYRQGVREVFLRQWKRYQDMVIHTGCKCSSALHCRDWQVCNCAYFYVNCTSACGRRQGERTRPEKKHKCYCIAVTKSRDKQYP